MEQAAHELMDASDYLTECVQRFTINGDVAFMEQYFEEALDVGRREKAIEKMAKSQKAGAAREQLVEALENSVKLMDREYYAMRLVIEAKGYTDYPEVLKNVVLSEEDKALSPEEKIRHATEMVLDNVYYDQKNKIRLDMKESLGEVYDLMYGVESSALTVLKKDIGAVHVLLLMQIVSICIMLRISSLFGIKPILKAVDKIKEDSPIPETGANEYVYLAKAYNKMYAKNKTNLAQLNFKASHDELTGAYNRAGYDLLLNNIELESSYMMLFDLDDFKSVNDNYGHEIGDKVLIRLVKVLKSAFRGDDYICRIGGDEFVVFMLNAGAMPHQLIEEKVEQINNELQKVEDGVPPISASVGIIHGKEANDASNLFEKIDAAMYESKKRGKHTYTFYAEHG